MSGIPRPVDDLDDAIYRNRYRHAAHGTYAGYKAGCRCSDCTRANRDYMREYARRTYDPAKRQARYETYGRAWYQRQREAS